MKTKEYISRYGEEAYNMKLEKVREWRKENPEKAAASTAKWHKENPEKVAASNAKWSMEVARKGGKYYEAKRLYNTTGIPGDKKRVRGKHGKLYKPLKNLVDPNGNLTQLHHQWCPQSAEFEGVALVELKPHRIGLIKPILILEGKITLLTEKDIRAQ